MRKRIISIFLMVIFCLSLVACDKENAKKHASDSSSTTSSESSKLNTNSSNYESKPTNGTNESENVDGLVSNTKKNDSDSSKFTVLMPDIKSTDYYVKFRKVKGDIKVLAIGDEQMQNTIRYLYRIAYSADYDITVGSCITTKSTIEEQLKSAVSDNKDFAFTKVEKDKTADKGTVSLSSALKSEEWNVIVLQQEADIAGVESSYDKLSEYIGLIKKSCKSNCKIVFSSSWAYSNNYYDLTYESNYGANQLNMFEKINTAISNKAKPSGVDIIAPIGTAIQNIRTSSIGDSIDNDAKLLRAGIGQYAASLTLFCAMTDTPVENVTFTSPCSNTEFASISRCVTNAIKKPFTLTKEG